VPASAEARIRVWTIHYRSHDGFWRPAYVALPRWYGPDDHPPIPLIISPHGRGVDGFENVRRWGDLPAAGPFAVVNPDGQGRRLALLSWGYSGQIADLARMPRIVEHALPWVRIDRHRVYAFGTSMGGQETLLLAARYPRLLAGAAAFDSVADLALQYRDFRLLPCAGRCRRIWAEPIGLGLQQLARVEVGATPRDEGRAYALRSPLTYARRLALSGVPLELWWSNADRTVAQEPRQSGRLFRRLRQINPAAPVEGFVGTWAHGVDMKEGTYLPLALAAFGLVPWIGDVPPGVRVIRARAHWPWLQP
jgi:pimeloyl-ACP methyl ester carboxylesterase